MNTHKDTSDLPNRDRRFASLRLKKRTRSWLRYLPASLMQFLWAGDKNGELAIANLALVDALDHPPAYGHLETLLKVFPELWKLDPKPFEHLLKRIAALTSAGVHADTDPQLQTVLRWLDGDPTPLDEEQGGHWDAMLAQAAVWHDGDRAALRSSTLHWDPYVGDCRLAFHRLRAIRSALHLAGLHRDYGHSPCTLAIAEEAVQGKVRLWLVEPVSTRLGQAAVGIVSVERADSLGWVGGRVWPAPRMHTYSTLARLSLAMAARVAASERARHRHAEWGAALDRMRAKSAWTRAPG